MTLQDARPNRYLHAIYGLSARCSIYTPLVGTTFRPVPTDHHSLHIMVNYFFFTICSL